ncbi:hypothetical protein [Granulicoccus phenolivorans]|uniref:hypothetical protein n=1 Tax=Granulicoccus phenolivorans TaxID=266854 RepID=UPI0004260D50|nr:hypothetical protein [Granulicoccus phenolivorans]
MPDPGPQPRPALALVESPAQLLNAIEWAYHSGTPTTAVVLGPTDPTTRWQLHRVAELAPDPVAVQWAEVRSGARAPALARVARGVRAAGTVVIGDPYSGIIHTLLNLVGTDPRLVVIDDGTATIRYAEQWATGVPLNRWHLGATDARVHPLRRRAQRLLGHRSAAVELFTAMPLLTGTAPHTGTGDTPTGDTPPVTPNTYAWVRDTFGPPRVLAGTDLMGTSLVESGLISEDAYLAGIAGLVAGRSVARYLPHRKESAAKLARIAALGPQLVRPALPMELYARIGPIGRTLLSFPSTVLHTLPLVLAGTGVEIAALSVADSWFTGTAAADQRDFVNRITG